MVMRRNPRDSSLKTPKSQSLFATPEESEAKESRAKAGAEFIRAYVDGGARGNPGPAGYGAYIEDAQGKMMAELSEYLGHKTNNHAEYAGLLASLEYAVKHGHGRIKVVSDSELMVKQIRGEYKVKSPELKELYDRARTLIRKLEHFEIRHVLRGENKNADRLANEAMDKGSGRPAKEVSEAKEVRGIVRGGMVEFFGEALPEGTVVSIKKKL